MAYSSHISWQSATSPVPMEVYPSLAFDSLFDNRGSLRNLSILDRVREEADGLSRRVGAADRAKLDEYLTSVRDVEKRAVAMRDARGVGRRPGPGPRPPPRRHAPARRRPPRGHPRAHAADVRPDRPRLPDRHGPGSPPCCSAATSRASSIRSSTSATAHHGASHDDTSDAYARVTRFYVEQFAYLAARLDAMPEGDGTVLDHSCLLFTNSLLSGSKHDATRVPLLLAGGLGGTLETGRVLDYRGRDDDERKLCSLYLGIMDRMGVALDRFGDADERLAGF